VLVKSRYNFRIFNNDRKLLPDYGFGCTFREHTFGCTELNFKDTQFLGNMILGSWRYPKHVGD